MLENSFEKRFEPRPHVVFIPLDFEIIASCRNIFLVSSKENSSTQIDENQNLELFAHFNPNFFELALAARCVFCQKFGKLSKLGEFLKRISGLFKRIILGFTYRSLDKLCNSSKR